jgi:Pyruvate/2-oxoacid:ferredoxin oxidoreductase gamma subunit
LLNQEIIPIPLTQTPTENEILENFKKVNLSFYTIPAGKICQEKLGNKVVSGIFLVSLASFKNLIPINPDSLLEAIEKVISKDHLDLNIKAFNLASQYAKKE